MSKSEKRKAKSREMRKIDNRIGAAPIERICLCLCRRILRTFESMFPGEMKAMVVILRHSENVKDKWKIHEAQTN